MYQIRCDNHILYDPRDEELTVLNPRCSLKVNSVGEGSFTILPNHPHYDKLKKLSSVFEVLQDEEVIFRGRMTNDSRDFYNRLEVDLEGIMGIMNDTIIPPFNFPTDFPESGLWENEIEYFLNWIVNRHNERQTEFWRRLRIGRVTVKAPDNYLTRVSENYMTTWEAMKTHLLDSPLGGYFCFRYEEDANYVDYLADFTDENGDPIVNEQQINLGENLLDFTNETDAFGTYSAILPLGGEVGEDDAKTTLTLESLPDGDLTEDLVKDGLYIYSKAAVEQYGWICAPLESTTWAEMTDAETLKAKAVEFLSGSAMLQASTITIKAVDLNFTDAEIQSFRLYKNILVNSKAHGIHNAKYPLTQLDIDILNPQNTTIVVGDTAKTLLDINSTNQASTAAKVNATASAVANLGSITDKVVALGTSDIWTFRRWSSGTFECWASVEAALDALAYPVTYAGEPCVQITEHNGLTHYYVIGKTEGSD